MHNSRSSTTPIVSSNPSTDVGVAPRRLPDELVLLIVDYCAYLEDNRERERTFAALCLLSRRYKQAAERHLYSRLTLTREVLVKGVSAGSATETLARRVELRPHVHAIEYECAYPQDVNEHPSVAALLLLLPSIEELVEPNIHSAALAAALRSGHVRIRRVVVAEWEDDVDEFVKVHKQAFSCVRGLRLDYLNNFGLFGFPPALRGITSLVVDSFVENGYLLNEGAALYPPSLESITLPLVTTWRDADTPTPSSTLAACQHLGHFGVAGQGDVEEYEQAIPPLAFMLHSAPASLLSVSIDATLRVRTTGKAANWELFTDQEVLPIRIPSSSTDLLEAIPVQVEHLSLVTNCFRAIDVAVHLVGARRPRALKTLRLGGDVGRVLGWILYGDGAAAGPFGALKGQLERDGVVVTTVPSRW
ncbi:hypothetical protein JCM8208_005343 [Rhodotorula glutinis]